LRYAILHHIFTSCCSRDYSDHASSHPAFPGSELRVAPWPETFGLCRRRILGSPRISRPSASPLLKLRVAPILHTVRWRLRCALRVAPAAASSGCSGDGASSRLDSPILRRYLAAELRVAPAPRFISAASRYRLQVAPLPASSGCRRWTIESPRSRILLAVLQLALQVAPSRPPVSPLNALPGLPRFLHLPAAP